MAAWSQSVRGQAANPDDPRALFISPATAGLAPAAQVITGYEMYYSGLGLHSGFAAVSVPNQTLGNFSLTGQYFASNIYRAGNYTIGYSRSLVDQRLSFGLELGVNSISFNSENFQLEDLNDPVFRHGVSKSIFDMGVSLAAHPVEPVFFGMSLKHLNRPNISLIGDNIRMPLKFQAGLMLRSVIGNPSLDFLSSDRIANVHLGFERWLMDHRLLLRANYYQYNLGATIGFIVPMSQYLLRIEYEYRHPLTAISEISGASHLFIMAFGFSKPEGNFAINVYPRDQEIVAGQDARLRVAIVRTGRFRNPIELELVSLEADTPSSAARQRLTKETTASFVIRTSSQTPPKKYTLHVVARSGSKEQIAPVSLTVKSPAQSGNKEAAGEQSISVLRADIQASVEKLVITETTKIRSRDPLLPYIFFEENKSDLNEDRYHILNPTKAPVTKFTFAPEKLLDIPTKYQNTLNVIARRLWDNPHMKIIIRGYNSDWGIEQGNLDLSRRRAESVRDYLVENCGVRAWQIKTEAHHLPSDPASNLDPRGREENQRVEISCPLASQPILDPIVTETSEIAASDESCHFGISNFQPGAGLSRWKIIIAGDQGDTFQVIDGNRLPDNAVAWNWKSDAGQSVVVGKRYRYRLVLQDKNGQTFETSWKTIQVERVSAIEREYIQKNVEKTRLILFKYDRADMDVTSKSLRVELALHIQKLKSNPFARLLIQGHTDIIGHPDYNWRLSKRRAESVTNYFVDRGIPFTRIAFEGFGMSQPLMTNSLPEGRMINRRVEIYILH